MNNQYRRHNPQGLRPKQVTVLFVPCALTGLRATHHINVECLDDEGAPVGTQRSLPVADGLTRDSKWVRTMLWQLGFAPVKEKEVS